MARSPANSVGFAGIKWELSRIFQAPGLRYFFSLKAGQQTNMAFVCSKILIPSMLSCEVTSAALRWQGESVLLSGETYCPCLSGLEMTKHVSPFWLLNTMFRNFIGKMTKSFLYYGRISKTTCRVLTQKRGKNGKQHSPRFIWWVPCLCVHDLGAISFKTCNRLRRKHHCYPLIRDGETEVQKDSALRFWDWCWKQASVGSIVRH